MTESDWRVVAAQLKGENQLLKQNLFTIETRLTKIESHLGKIVWMILGAVGSALLAYVLQGGFPGGA